MSKRIWLAALLVALAPACSGDNLSGPGNDTPSTSNKPACAAGNVRRGCAGM